MKNLKFVFLLVLCLATSALFSQTEKGRFITSGSANLSFASLSSKITQTIPSGDDLEYDGTKITAFEFTPSLGYFVVDNLDVGLFLGYDYAKVKQDADEDNYITEWENKSSLFTAGVFAEYYFGDAAYKPFAGIRAGLGFGKDDYSYGAMPSRSSSEEKYNVLMGEISAGVAYFMTQNLALKFALGYGLECMKYKDYPSDGYDYKDRVGGIEVLIAFSVLLGNE